MISGVLPGEGSRQSSKTVESLKVLGMAGIMAAATVLEAVGEAKERVLEGGKEAAGAVVEAKYGGEAKEAYDNSMEAAINMQQVQCAECVECMATLLSHAPLLPLLPPLGPQGSEECGE
jgi:hypothetical protein